ncbi:MerR family transcriptional regulator [Microbacterium imperiale]|uniref:MerR family transcriptional regulator n=1 Tax=Microbacterium imperiale TaxID=33884 RepID=A0A9W6HFG2_9MICO|nr:MerR family transcriptional regulator [Microbacterium imperiale]MBP2420550.1 DNA-binding transcriptional MerR regulator [Microbacterium imperiale]MDS0200372.1 MerR family transcriptional regulator [Microbacterium imperiale]BFE40891.1 MerR family transcriptional regulator [Microbacterium imperiale]GLJ79564.1 MerR family transcriptional regulator [Microbacterium imperiale]
MTDADGLTVGQTAARLAITVRTLHHWDEIGLAPASSRTDAGYRLYTAADIERLHRVIVYREIGLGLDQIRAVLDEPGVEPLAALRTQRDDVSQHLDRLRHLRTGLDRMIEAHERGVLLTAEEQAVIFGPDWNPDWPAMARRRYGHTPQWQQYAERAATRTPDQWRDVTAAMTDVDLELGAALDAGVQPGSAEADRLVERHRDAIGAFFPVTRSMQVCLGRMYEADPAFTAHYEDIRPGLTSWLRRSIDASARAHGIDPDAATWE